MKNPIQDALDRIADASDEDINNQIFTLRQEITALMEQIKHKRSIIKTINALRSDKPKNKKASNFEEVDEFLPDEVKNRPPSEWKDTIRNYLNEHGPSNCYDIALGLKMTQSAVEGVLFKYRGHHFRLGDDNHTWELVRRDNLD